MESQQLGQIQLEVQHEDKYGELDHIKHGRWFFFWWKRDCYNGSSCSDSSQETFPGRNWRDHNSLTTWPLGGWRFANGLGTKSRSRSWQFPYYRTTGSPQATEFLPKCRCNVFVPWSLPSVPSSQLPAPSPLVFPAFFHGRGAKPGGKTSPRGKTSLHNMSWHSGKDAKGAVAMAQPRTRVEVWRMTRAERLVFIITVLHNCINVAL